MEEDEGDHNSGQVGSVGLVDAGWVGQSDRLSLSHIFRKESQKIVTASKVEPVVDRAIWRERDESQKEKKGAKLIELKQR